MTTNADLLRLISDIADLAEHVDHIPDDYLREVHEVLKVDNDGLMAVLDITKNVLLMLEDPQPVT
jgi:hypothetical protein